MRVIYHILLKPAPEGLASYDIFTLTGFSKWVSIIEFSADGKVITIISDNTKAFRWDAKTGISLETKNLEGFIVPVFALSADGTKIITQDEYNTDFKLWDIVNNKTVNLFRGHKKWVAKVEYSPDGNTLVSASGDHTAILWNLLTGEKIHILEGHKDAVRSAKFSSDGKLVITSSFDKTVKIWDVESGRMVYDLMDHKEKLEWAEFSADQKYIVSVGSDGEIYVWERPTGDAP